MTIRLAMLRRNAERMGPQTIASRVRRFLRVAAIILIMAAPCYAGSSAAENKAKADKAKATKVVTREFNGEPMAWVERDGQPVSMVYKGKGAESKAREFRKQLLGN